MLKFRNAQIADLDKLEIIENLCFSSNEAATRDAFKIRIEMISDTFIVVEENSEIIGLINGPVINVEYISDDLFETLPKNVDTGGYQSILGLAVAPEHQGKGIASLLLNELEQVAKKQNRVAMTLTCKESLIKFYEKNGYVNRGISDSQHGGVVWYNMVKEI